MDLCRGEPLMDKVEATSNTKQQTALFRPKHQVQLPL